MTINHKYVEVTCDDCEALMCYANPRSYYWHYQFCQKCFEKKMREKNE